MSERIRIGDPLVNAEFHATVADLRLAFVNYARLQERMRVRIEETRMTIDEALDE